MRRLAVLAILALSAAGSDFRSNWRRTPDGGAIGPEYQANPLRAWQIRGGRLECYEDGGDRNVTLLTRQMTDRLGTLRMTVRVGRLDPNAAPKQAWVGFRLGLRAAGAEGLNVGVTSEGRLFIGAPEDETPLLDVPLENLKLSVEWERGWLSIEVNQTRLSKNLPRNDINGGIALVCGAGGGRFWFRDWTLSGSRIGNR
jgi:alkaline phosphatase D